MKKIANILTATLKDRYAERPPVGPEPSLLKAISKGLATIVVVCLLISCTEPVSSLPVRPVGIRINTNQDMFVLFQPSCLYDYVIADAEGFHYHDYVRRYQEGYGAHGFGGVVIIVTGSDLNPYSSFDMACPACYLSTGKCHKTYIEGFFAICPDCGENYDLTCFGTPTKGLSKERLKQYETNVANGIITVRN